MISVNISNELSRKCPVMSLGVIQCGVWNTEYDHQLWEEIHNMEEEIRGAYDTARIKERENIKATRQIYKACGKAPSRYRPSAEALHRRIVRGIELYQINTLVDIINLVSLKTGYSIGGFDGDKVKGNVVAGIGHENEEFWAIGRGKLNIEGLPVLRDREGPIGTPTSDEERTALSLDTKNLFININHYSQGNTLQEAMRMTEDLLIRYASAKGIKKNIIMPEN